MSTSQAIELDPVLPEGHQQLLFTLDPTSNGIATASTQISQNAPVYLATYDFAESRELLLDTYQVCAAADALSRLPEVLQDQDAALEQFSRIGTLYAAKLLQHLTRLRNEIEAAGSDEETEGEGSTTAQKRERLLEKQQHWTAVYQVYALAQVLYFPSLQDMALSEAPLPVVGEQLLHFINTVDPQPSREDGLYLASMSAPYSEEIFWSYLPRCIIRGLFKAASTLTASMLDHPLPFVRHAASLICTLLDHVPKPSLFSTSYEHLRATHTFRMDVQRAISELTDQFDDLGRWTVKSSSSGRSSRNSNQVASLEDRQDWLTRILLLLRLLKGEEEMVLNSSDDWKEALAAWAMLVRPTMTRDEIPDTVQRIWHALPLDSDVPGEKAQEAFILGHTSEALHLCDDLSPWLSSHLADLLDKLGILEPVVSDPVLDKADGSINSSSQRDWYLLRWADQLQGDEGVWRIALHYLSFVMASDDDSLAEAAEARMKATLKHVKWQDPTVPSASASNAATSELTNGGTGGNATVNDEKRDDVKETTVEDVLQACYEYGFKDVAVDVCKTIAEKLQTVREYGRAVAYAVQAADTVRIARITELLIDEYVQRGAAEFARLVDAFPTRLLRPDETTNKTFFKSLVAPTHPENDMNEDDASGQGDLQLSLFQDRISFLARYRDVHAFFANDQKLEAAKALVGLLRSGVVPKRFQAVLLLDALSLLEDESEVYFDQHDSFELMRCLEEIDTRSKTNASLLQPIQTLLGGQGNWDTTALTLRLSLTKNLSRCLCMA